MTPDPIYLTIPEVVPVLRALGFSRVTEKCVQNYADQKKLPFFKSPVDGRRYIQKAELLAFFQRLQNEASNEARRAA